MKVYKSLGVFRPVFELFNSLDLKSVQHESLGFLVFKELNDWRIWRAELQNAVLRVQNFHRYAQLDLVDSIDHAYKHFHIH